MLHSLGGLGKSDGSVSPTMVREHHSIQLCGMVNDMLNPYVEQKLMRCLLSRVVDLTMIRFRGIPT